MAMDHDRHFSDYSPHQQTISAYNNVSDSHILAVNGDDHERGDHRWNHERGERNRGYGYGYNRGSGSYYARGSRYGNSYAAGSCARLRNQARLDTLRGHPDAGQDLLNRFGNRCR